MVKRRRRWAVRKRRKTRKKKRRRQMQQQQSRQLQALGRWASPLGWVSHLGGGGVRVCV